MVIAAVIVTFNRLDLLRECLCAFSGQTRKPELLIIVNNASTDGTSEFLSEWEVNNGDFGMLIEIISMEHNEGGSGGFYTGTKRALELGADWVWVSDDDAIPKEDVFEKLEIHIKQLKNTNEISAVCTQVQTDGIIAPSNRSYRKMTFFKMNLKHVPEYEYKKEMFECDNFSYVGVLMNRIKLEQIGLIHPEYFIWRDDVEHSWRLSEIGKIICFPDMIVNHKLKSADYKGISWKTYYAYRNDLLMLGEHVSKRYYYFKVITAIIHGIRSGNKMYFELYMDAVKAAKKFEKGLNSKYKPGMKM